MGQREDDELVPFADLDRLLAIEMRPRGMPRGIVAPLVRAARGGAREPLTYRVARDLLAHAGADVLILTGLQSPERFPHGEIDGPLGAVALARALLGLGCSVAIGVEPEIVPVVHAVAREAGACGVEVVESAFATAVDAEHFASRFSVAVTVEKLGENGCGTRHLVCGTPVISGDVHADRCVRVISAAGGLTIGIADGGNEIGFGAIADQARTIVPRGEACGCPCGGGIICATACDYLVPATISNLGAYALVAALVLLAGRPELVVAPDEVGGWIELALANGAICGGSGPTDLIGDDGVPLVQLAAYVELVRGIALQRDALTTEARR